MDKTLFEILACPLCKGQVRMDKERQELVCRPCGVAYPVRDGIPVMLEGEARTLSAEERLNEAS
ncbi:Trm112 family protein [uncultured Endozoicomonas sp.]|uniref:Trm112 family protein n=1 Tax=uncultured Endozoicomonas sp. TaxID=432652 RepID=UPI002630418B|nr:Trm112 family protein [uncultured Endozoicomonas sp.]